MTDTDGSMTDRWMGVFRSMEREPIGEARYARVQAHKRRSLTLALVGLVLVAGPGILTAVAVALDSTRLVAYALLAWIVGPVLGAGPLHSGLKRLQHLRGVQPDSEVDVFVGAATAPGVSATPGSANDRTTGRLLSARVIEEGRTHRLVVHPETGLLLEVDGALVKEFVGGDMTITARVPGGSAKDPAATTRPLGVLEKHELKLLGRRVTRGTWGPLLGVASAATALACLLFTITSDASPSVEWVVTVLSVGTSLLLVAAVDWWARRRLRAKLQRDGEAGLHRKDDRWLLPESGICWEEHGRPGPLRLAGGGLGSEADGRARPMMF